MLRLVGSNICDRPPEARRQTSSTGINNTVSARSGPIQAAVNAVERLLTGGLVSPRLSNPAENVDPQEAGPARSARSNLLRNIGSFLSGGAGDNRERRDRSMSLSAVDGRNMQV